jgi:hypothetical protein
MVVAHQRETVVEGVQHLLDVEFLAQLLAQTVNQEGWVQLGGLILLSPQRPLLTLVL